MGVGAVVLGLVALAAAPPGELIGNGAFERDATGWHFWYSPGQAVGAAQWVAREPGGALRVAVERRDTPSAVQIYHGPFAVRQGQRYLLRFQARATQPFGLTVKLMEHETPYRALGLDAEVPLTRDWRTYSLLAVGRLDSEQGRLDFMPAGSFELDEVSLLPAPPAALGPPAAVTLGSGWRGDPKALLDGQPATQVVTEQYAAPPVFATLELGGSRTVRQIVAQGRENPQYSAIDRLEAEISLDGERWFRWARASKETSAAAGATTWRAQGLPVVAALARLRVAAVRGGGVLTDLLVETAPAEEGLAVTELPEALPAGDLAFLGWDYDRYGYELSPGERPALRWINRGHRRVLTPVAWRLERYYGEPLAHGTGTLQAAPGEVASLPLTLPDNLPDGQADLAWWLPPDETPQPFSFEIRRAGEAPLDLRLVTLIDNNDPEGWAAMLAGPLANRIEATSDWPERGEVDAALVASEAWPTADPRLQRLRQWVEAGGRALVFGIPGPGLRELLPVEVAAAPRRPEAQRLGALPALPLWRGFRPDPSLKHRAVAITPRPGARVLASWADGTPAVVEAARGQGQVIYLASATGQVWERRSEVAGVDSLTMRLLYHLARRPAAMNGFEQAAVAARAERARPVALRPAVNVGRFGWKIAEGGLVENLREDGGVDCPGDGGPGWSPRVSGLERAAPRVVTLNWLAKTVAWHTLAGECLRATLSLASPLILWEGGAEEVTLALPPQPRLAYAGRSGWRLLEPGQTLSGSDLGGGGLVVFSADPQRRDQPRLLVLSRRPESIQMAESLVVRCGPKGFGALGSGRLWGLRRLGPGEAAGWSSALPPTVVEQAERLTARFGAWPEACDESASLRDGVVSITNRYRFRTIASEFGIAAERLAPWPPVLALAQRAGAPVALQGAVLDTGVATKYGPLQGTAGEMAAYRLPLPPHDHYGVVPVAGQREMQESIDHYALDGIRAVTRASGGLVASNSFVEDLRRYMSAGTHEDAFASPCIDLYKWWYCFPTLLARPAYGEAARREVDAWVERHYRETLGYYPHKVFVRYRREPWTGLDYTVSFIWPVQVDRGRRFFVDQNESAAVILSCLATYARYYGDWSTVAANWNLLERIYEYLPRFHDWATMASSNMEYFSTVGIDMLNSEYPGSLAYAELARQTGRAQIAEQASVLAAKALVPAVARFAMPGYVASITAPGDTWRTNRYYFSYHEQGLDGQPTIEMRGGPESIMELGIGMLDTAKGTGAEITRAYQAWVPAAMEAYQRELLAEEQARQRPVGWPHLLQRSFLGWPRAELLTTARRFHEKYPKRNWLSTMGPGNLALIEARDSGLYLADWLPAEYLSGGLDPASGLLRLRFALREAGSATVRVVSRQPLREVAVDGRAVKAAWRSGELSLVLPSGEHEVTARLAR